jgi:undecaprenyl-diphosphatase
MIQEFNSALFFAINNGMHSSVGDLLIGNATYLGNGWIAFPIALIVMILIDRKHFTRNFLFLLSAALLEAVILQSLKSLIDSPRPLSVFAGQIAQGKVVVYIMFEQLYDRGFPSGHTQTAWCIAIALIWMAKHSMMSLRGQRLLQLISITLAVLISISRVYVGAHFPADVAGGFVIGTVIVLIVANVVDRRLRNELKL